MALNDDLADAYRARGVPTPWRRITPDAMKPTFEYWYRALPSPRAKDETDDPEIVDAADDAELLIHDPVAALRKADIPCEEGARIATLVVNHEKTLNRFIMHAHVVVSSNPHTIGIMLVKEEK